MVYEVKFTLNEIILTIFNGNDWSLLKCADNCGKFFFADAITRASVELNFVSI